MDNNLRYVFVTTHINKDNERKGIATMRDVYFILCQAGQMFALMKTLSNTKQRDWSHTLKCQLFKLTHWALVTAFGDIDLGQHWFR